MEQRIKKSKGTNCRSESQTDRDAHPRRTIEELVKYLARRAAERDHDASLNSEKQGDRPSGGDKDSK
jgi:hypothetical protein